MKERGILFSSAMVRALLAGAKTQTRRALKMPPAVVKRGIHPRMGEWMPNRYTKGSGQYAGGNPDFTGDQPPGLLVTCLDGTCQRVPCPYGVPGDRLWVRETHAQFAVGDKTGTAPQCVAYRATCDADGDFEYVNNGDEVMRIKVTKWTPAIFMPRWASRITLEVTEVRVQRLQDISEEDAKAEGVEPDADCLTNRCRRPYFDRYMDLWDEINGNGSWKTNPWVWVVGFRRLP